MHDWLANLLDFERTPWWLEHAPYWAAVLWFVAVGGCVGSFLNVVALRTPKGEDFVARPSECPVCGHRLRWRHNLPLIGYPMLRGRCYDCHTRIPIRYWLWEVAFAALFGVIGAIVARPYF
ncbi:prepilin peptidase [Botrimarina sp.]|uniref:prepilin peptidase n=1 Tax=Botrimarina sp. TaxID=2795802 RepID=UPI0032EEE58E